MTRFIPTRWLASAVATVAVVLQISCGGGGGGPPPLAVSAASPPAGTTGVAYAGYAFMASNSGVQPYTWSESGPLPAGLAFSASGQLTGTPTTAGTYPIVVTVTDSSVPGLTANAPVSLLVNDSPIVIATAPSPPAATAVYPYQFRFAASGGSQPYRWSATGTVPPGLSVGADGTVSGTPTAVGFFSFSVTATDSAPTAEVSSQLFTIMVAAPSQPLTITTSEVPTGTVGAVYAPFQLWANAPVSPGALVWTEAGALDGLSLSTTGALSGTPTAVGKFPITVDVTDVLNRTASGPIIVRVSLARAGALTLTGSMQVPRSGHTATLLNSGKVLVAGGADHNANPSAELYDPMAKMFTATGIMTEARIGHTATLLAVAAAPNYGKVLIAGSGDATAELYDPATGTFTATGSMTRTRDSPTATLLQTGSARIGSVLIVGGTGDTTAEIYDPGTRTFTATGSTSVRRNGQTATQLLDGRVLVAGGDVAGQATATAELYDPVRGTFAPTGSMTTARSGHTATRLQDGTVLILGLTTADLYDPHSGTFIRVGSFPYQRVGSFPFRYPDILYGQTASLRQDGSVLAAGGFSLGHGYHSTVYQSVSAAALFGPESDGFTATGALNASRYTHTATALPDGTVLIIGGSSLYCVTPCTGVRPTTLSSAELFN